MKQRRHRDPVAIGEREQQDGGTDTPQGGFFRRNARITLAFFALLVLGHVAVHLVFGDHRVSGDEWFVLLFNSALWTGGYLFARRAREVRGDRLEE